jgi:hypothetical protein
MDDSLYPKKQFTIDLKTVRNMNISDELKREKGEALAHLYYNQNKEWMIDRFAIADIRETILKEY